MRLNEPLFGIVILFLQPQAALSEGRRPLGGWLFCSRLYWVMQ